MIGLSPLSTGHPLRFQPKWVRPSTGSYPRFSLPMDSSPGFASAACDSYAILKARFHCGSVQTLTSPHTATRWLILQKARRHNARLLRLLVGARFQVLFHSPLGVLFTFPSRYWFAIGLSVVFSLAGWSPLVHTGFLVSRATQVPPCRACCLRVRASHPLWGPFPGASPDCSALALSAVLQPRSPPQRCRFGLLRVRSPLLAQSLLFSFPPGNEMFQFPGFAPHSVRWHGRPCRVAPFGDPRVMGYLLLTAAYRSLSRPSSPPRAKASFMCPSLLSF